MSPPQQRRRRRTRAAALAAAALAWGLGACDDGDGAATRPASSPFFPANAALAETPLGARHFASGAGAGFELVIDQGIREVADVSDVFRDPESGAIRVGGSAPLRPLLEARLARVARPLRKAWRDHARSFVHGGEAAPTAEGMLSRPTPEVLVPEIPPSDPIGRMVQPVISTLERLIRTRTDVPVRRVRTRGGPWLQDFLTAFDDGTLGIPPHFDAQAFQRRVGPVRDRARDFVIGGQALTMGRVIETPLRDLRGQARRFRQLRSFVEGGNVVFAESRDGEVRAIVGRHTLELSGDVYGLDAAAARALVADDFRLAPEAVVVVSQPDYHIDLHLRAAGPGRVFLASPRAGLQLLDRMLLDASQRGDGPRGRESLESLRRRVARADASPLGRRLRRRLAEVRSQLEATGFRVVAYPSLYYSYLSTGEYEQVDGRFEPRRDSRLFVHVNTLNGRYVTGSGGRVSSFVLASGWDGLDRRIEAFEKEHGVSEVYFLGRSLAAPRFWGNQVLLAAAGIGCLTNL